MRFDRNGCRALRHENWQEEVKRMKALVATPHRSSYPDPIEFKEGEVVTTTGKQDDEFPGWIWVRTSNGKEGWAPEAYLQQQITNQAIASSDYSAKELDTSEGDEIEILSELGGWVWCRNAGGQEGWIPVRTVTTA